MNEPQATQDGRQSILELNHLITETRGFFKDLEETSARILAGAGLTPPERRLLMSLKKYRLITVPRLARKNDVSRQYVQTVMNSLAKRGWVIFRDNPDHKRSRRLDLAPEAEERIRAVMAREGEALQRTAAGLNPDPLRQAVEVLRQVRKRLVTRSG
jgi:DNA-binding MarR family transcriptional regulator